MAYLVLVRHGQSEWNAKGLWTGFTDIPLSEKGKEEARKAAQLISDLPIDVAYTSDLSRAQQTLDEILKKLNKTEIEIIQTPAIKERDYGEMTGKNKWDIKKEFGDEQFLKWRRGWDEPIPDGETLKDVYNRVVPYYKEHIEPQLKSGKNVILAAHGNSLRALIKYLDTISDTDISKLELATGEVYVYQIDNNGTVTAKEIKTA